MSDQHHQAVQAPRFMALLNEVLPNPKDQEALQRTLGAALSGPPSNDLLSENGA